MRIWSLFFILSSLGFSLSGWAQSCPTARSLSYLPVHDQDGLGTCSANTAALMMQYNLGLPKSPSYIQMSITESSRAERFFYTDRQGKERIFNWGADICDVAKASAQHGFCDFDKMGFDFVGTMDNTGAQQDFLDKVARFLEAKESDIRQLRTQLISPATRAQAIRRLAYFFHDTQNTCSLPFREYISTKALGRLKAYWESILASNAPTNQKNIVSRLLSQTFLPSGAPHPSALMSHRDFLDSNPDFERQLAAAEQAGTSAAFSGAEAEDKFITWWGNWNDLDTSSIPQREGNFYLADRQAFRSCAHPTELQALDRFITAPTCQLTASAPLSSEQLAQAEFLISALEQLATNQLDPQAAIVNILSPACASQMQQRANQYSKTCADLYINSAATAATAKANTVAEICAGRAVGVSICTGFFKATTPIDSKFCDDDTAGIADHSYHAVTLIGYRPGPTGRRQFLIQNSWGNTCPFRKHVGGVPPALNDLVECESQSETDTSSTGRFWVDEDLLFNNTYQLSTFSP